MKLSTTAIIFAFVTSVLGAPVVNIHLPGLRWRRIPDTFIYVPLAGTAARPIGMSGTCSLDEHPATPTG